MRKKTTHRSRNRRDARACDRSGQPRNLGLRGRLSPVFSTADTQPVVLLWGGLQLSLLQYEKEGNVLCAHIRGSSVKKEPDREWGIVPSNVEQNPVFTTAQAARLRHTKTTPVAAPRRSSPPARQAWRWVPRRLRARCAAATGWCTARCTAERRTRPPRAGRRRHLRRWPNRASSSGGSPRRRSRCPQRSSPRPGGRAPPRASLTRPWAAAALPQRLLAARTPSSTRRRALRRSPPASSSPS